MCFFTSTRQHCPSSSFFSSSSSSEAALPSTALCRHSASAVDVQYRSSSFTSQRQLSNLYYYIIQPPMQSSNNQFSSHLPVLLHVSSALTGWIWVKSEIQEQQDLTVVKVKNVNKLLISEQRLLQLYTGMLFVWGFFLWCWGLSKHNDLHSVLSVNASHSQQEIIDFWSINMQNTALQESCGVSNKLAVWRTEGSSRTMTQGHGRACGSFCLSFRTVTSVLFVLLLVID